MIKSKKLVECSDLMEQWDYDKNNLEPSYFTVGSGKKVWWKCSKGHSWEATIINRTKGNNCPYCGNRKVFAGFNDLQTLYPGIAKDWAYEKNAPLQPSQFTSGSEKKVWWCCDEGHYWQALICNRVSGTNCPYCSGHSVLAGFNDLQTISLDLVKEWDWKKNDILPSQLTAMSGRMVWWRCEKGHSWKMTVCARGKGSKCPYCNNQKVLVGFNDLISHSPEIATEWDCEKNIIKPSQIMYGSRKKVWWKCGKGHSWQANVSDRVRGTNCPYCSNRRVIEGVNDLKTLNPELAKEWDQGKNELMPSQVTLWSDKKVWWKCGKGHSWEARTADRSSGKNCPYCASRLLLIGFNDLQTGRPDIANEWDYEKNTLIPSQVFVCSNTSIWWKCSLGHSWKVPVCDRTSGGNGCPYCAGKKVLAGFNDLKTLNPLLADEWDTEKNDIAPSQVALSSQKSVWWKCEFGHSWKSHIAARSRGDGCPYCSGKKVLKGFNDLQTLNPKLAIEWDNEKNILKPSQVTRCSGKKVWWRCKLGHSWKIAISSRTNGSGCPYCCNQKILSGFNDLQTLNPQLVGEWDFEKNTLRPSQVALNSNQLVWWKCSLGHSWKTTVASRSSAGNGCPYCQGKVQYIPKCVN